MKKQLDIPRLAFIRDLFVFSCFTGISYADMYKLTKEQIIYDSKGSGYIHLYRTKTNHPAFIPIFPQAQKILDEYIGQDSSGKVFRAISNQKTNAYLKELADICGIKKKLTYHQSRHTFGTTITLAINVALQNVSKMLGHSSTRMTQHYARVLDHNIMEDMQGVAKLIFK